MSRGDRSASANARRGLSAWRGCKGIVAAFALAVAAYVAWIPAVADNAHPVLAALASVAFYGALVVCVALVVDVIRRKSSGSASA